MLMEMKTKFFSVVMASALLLAACGDDNTADSGDTSASDKEQQTLRISIGVNNDHPEYEGIEKFKELVEAETDDFDIELYHSGQIADDRSAIEMLQLGSLDITIPSTSPLVNFVPEYGVFDLPFTIPNEEVADELLDGEFGEHMLTLLEDQSLVGLAWWENGFRNLTNDVRPVATVEDVSGMKVRTMENAIHLDAWKALGANPTPMAFTELFTALQQGTVDGQENPYPTIDLSQYAEVQEHVSNTSHVYTPFIFLFSKQIWDEFTSEQQEILQEAAVEAGKYNRERNRAVAQESLERLKENMTFTEVTPEEHARFQEAVKPVIEKHAGDIGDEIVEDYLTKIEEIVANQ